MSNLKEERTIPESVTSLDAFPATDTQRFVDDIFIVRVFNEPALDGSCGTELVFCSGIEVIWFWFKVACTEFTVSAHDEIVNTFDR